jgi:hypothetical protein
MSETSKDFVAASESKKLFYIKVVSEINKLLKDKELNEENYKEVLLECVQELDPLCMDEGTYLKVCDILKRLYNCENDASDENSSQDSDETSEPDSDDDEAYNNWYESVEKAIDEDSVEAMTQLFLNGTNAIEDESIDFLYTSIRENSIECFFHIIDNETKVIEFLNENPEDWKHIIDYSLNYERQMMADYLRFKRETSYVI